MKKGKYCTFDKTTGIKKYISKQACDFAYNAQKKAYEVGAAPKVIKKIDDFSFQTEIADTDFIMKNLKSGVYYNALFPELHEKLVEIFKDNPNKERWGPSGIDMANHNLGLYNGKVVMVDFY